MNVTVSVPEELYRRASEVAAAANVLVDDLFASASRGSYEKFRRVMAKVPAVEPPEHDRL
jgi:hypothetical protein